MRYFAVKTSDREIVNEFYDGDSKLVIGGLNSYENIIIAGFPVFLVFGGDGVPWDLGTVAVCKTLSGPVNRGYDREKPKNYEIELEVIACFPRTLSKADFKYYEGTYDSFVGVRTKGERNQALLEITKETSIAIFRAILDYFPELENSIASLVEPTVMECVKKDISVLVPQILSYGQSPKRTTDIDNNAQTSITGGKNILLYGVPGCGKSHTVNKYCSDDDFMERIVFHPDYTYSDFVGQILPALNDEGQLQYLFTEGPFTRIMKKAIEDPNNMYYIVIEEINRGNAPAIFGDIFQLLDRNINGESVYSITNYDISNVLFDNNKYKKVRIPSNLTVLATMNTSDQNVFIMDTAFKRRWNMKMIPNKIESAPFANKSILDTAVTWYQFASVINDLIMSEDSGIIGNGDKRLGAFFVTENDICNINESGELKYNPTFAEKVLMYLWNDVFVYDRDKVFKQEYTSLEQLVEGFEKNKFDIFNLNFNVTSLPEGIGNV